MASPPPRRLQRVTEDARRHVEHLRAENDKLQALVQSLQDEQRRLADEYAGIQEELNGLAVLYAAADRMHGTLDPAEIVAVVDDVVSTLIGCEDVGVFERRGGPPRWLTLPGRGPRHWDAGRLERAGSAHAALLAGDTWFTSEVDDEPSAVLPLKVGSRVMGALALGRLLPQKDGRLTTVDRELLEVLALHAGPALHCASMATRHGLEPGS